MSLVGGADALTALARAAVPDGARVERCTLASATLDPSARQKGVRTPRGYEVDQAPSVAPRRVRGAASAADPGSVRPRSPTSASRAAHAIRCEPLV